MPTVRYTTVCPACEEHFDVELSEIPAERGDRLSPAVPARLECDLGVSCTKCHYELDAIQRQDLVANAMEDLAL